VTGGADGAALAPGLADPFPPPDMQAAATSPMTKTAIPDRMAGERFIETPR
jgi:hypothetical protein